MAGTAFRHVLLPSLALKAYCTVRISTISKPTSDSPDMDSPSKGSRPSEGNLDFKTNRGLQMGTQRQPDAVDAILAQWHRERPDLDVTPMGKIGRINRCSALLQRRLEKAFSAFALTHWEFDVLATLRRSGAPFRLTPTALFSALMVSSGTMTHRLKGLEGRGLLQRLAHPDDARSLLVQLTPDGLALIDRAVEAHVVNEPRILAAFKASDLVTLDARLSNLLALLESPGD